MNLKNRSDMYFRVRPHLGRWHRIIVYM
ncbi:hypothetical protein F383_01529 [Gossypium arboreum]|uniref:Uncharacterized protein n=1 Tax=Gossypium arboreum TaxID=29729 RepID=A0A0B0PA20_GOSAR|nr:hypothetical protein F383_01529 [Gossypium arboreum]